MTAKPTTEKPTQLAVRVKQGPRLKRGLPGYFPFRIGASDAAILSDGPIPLPVPEGPIPLPPLPDIYPGIDPEALEVALQEAHAATEPALIEQNVLIADIGGHLVLFDCGCGDSGVFGPMTGRLQRSLYELGVSPGDIESVFLSHAHSDHCWGVMGTEGSPAFPEARIFMPRAEFDHWMGYGEDSHDETARGFRERLLPLRARIELLDNGSEPMRGVEAFATAGHTPGHMSFLVGEGESRLCVVADVLLHHVTSFAFAGVENHFDYDRSKGVETRMSLLGRLADQRMRLVGYHLPWPGLGFVGRDGKAFRYIPESMSPFAS